MKDLVYCEGFHLVRIFGNPGGMRRNRLRIMEPVHKGYLGDIIRGMANK